ncbi:MAG TPA: helicase [Epulopiscium sp.]|nr:helicase [Candidatus Epulonipiscium sp.]
MGSGAKAKNKGKTKKPLSKELIEIAKNVKEYKLACEANIVSSLYKDPELYYHTNLELKEFSNNIWKVYWQIGYDIIIVEQKSTLDEITIGLYLEKHPKLKDKYDEYKGYETIYNAQKYVSVDNLDGYITELQKWNAVINLLKFDFPIQDRLSDFADMTAEEIYDEYEAKINHIFANVEGEEETFSLGDGIHELIDRLHEGMAVGLPLYESDTLNKEVGGLLKGNLTLIGGLSGSGKTTFVRNTHLKSIIDASEKILILLNEEGLAKWQREMLVWVANNIYKKDMQKYKIRDGKYKPEFKELLHKCADWIIEHDDSIKVLPFKTFNTAKTVKQINKYASMGVNYFVLDTFKMDSDDSSDNAMWMKMKQNMVKIYDTIKESNKNVHITVTFQLGKQSAKQRFYTQDNIGESKGIVDVASTCLMIRNLFEDEYEEGTRKLQCFRYEGKSKIGFYPTKGKHYQLIFIVKNREGASNEFQILVEHDLSRNVYKEVGICSVPVDF